MVSASTVYIRNNAGKKIMDIVVLPEDTNIVIHKGLDKSLITFVGLPY